MTCEEVKPSLSKEGTRSIGMRIYPDIGNELSDEGFRCFKYLMHRDLHVEEESSLRGRLNTAGDPDGSHREENTTSSGLVEPTMSLVRVCALAYTPLVYTPAPGCPRGNHVAAAVAHAESTATIGLRPVGPRETVLSPPAAASTPSENRVCSYELKVFPFWCSVPLTRNWISFF